jgi:hypothetical protein
VWDGKYISLFATLKERDPWKAGEDKRIILKLILPK